jgi:hypothetical protein
MTAVSYMQPGTPTTPGTPAKPIPSDLKEKVQALFKTAKDGVIKATDFNVEFQKKYGASRPGGARAFLCGCLRIANRCGCLQMVVLRLFFFARDGRQVVQGVLRAARVQEANGVAESHRHAAGGGRHDQAQVQEVMRPAGF